MDSGEESQVPDSQRRQKYHRHTPIQIQKLEAVFKKCPRPDENKRAALSRELGLEQLQIKFWFQNRRTQMKTKNERADTSNLREENDKIRRELVALREALNNAICPNCGGPPVGEDFFDMQKLRMENARLKEELDRMSSLGSKYLGQPLTQMPVAPRDLSVGVMSGGPALGQPSQDLDLLGGSSSGMYQSGLPLQMPAPATEMERPVMINAASRALEELIRLAQAGDHVWVKGPPGDHGETLNTATYDSLFSKPDAGFRPQNSNVEGSRDTGNVFMSAIALVDVFMDTNKWMEFFPGIVSRAHIVDVLVDGSNESLIMMHEELHVLTPLVPTRKFSFLRYCKQLEQGMWAVVDVSMDGQREAHYGVPPSRSRRLPSGCIITDMSGYSKVTWVEHMEIQEMLPINLPFGNLVLSGAAYGAHRWLAALQRSCDRLASLAALGLPHHDPSGVTAEARWSMMKLTQRMVSSFCARLTSSPMQEWTLLPGNTDESFRVFTLPTSGVVIGAATSFWLPILCDNVFSFLSNVNMRSQWDVLAHGHPVQELSRITTGADPGNFVSLLQGLNSSQNSVLILQESCNDTSGSLLVYTPIDTPAANVVMNGEDPSNILLLPSGIVILPDVRPGAGAAGAGRFSSAAPPPGCVVTVSVQILVSSLPVSNVDAQSVGIANNIITTTVQRIRAALNCMLP